MILIFLFTAFMFGLQWALHDAADVEQGFDERLRDLERTHEDDLPDMEAQYQLPLGWKVVEGSRFCALLDENDGGYSRAYDAYVVDWQTRYDPEDTGSWMWVISSAAYYSSLCLEP